MNEWSDWLRGLRFLHHSRALLGTSPMWPVHCAAYWLEHISVYALLLLMDCLNVCVFRFFFLLWDLITNWEWSIHSMFVHMSARPRQLWRLSLMWLPCVSEWANDALLLLIANNWRRRWSHRDVYLCPGRPVTSHVPRLQQHVSPVTLSHAVRPGRWWKGVSEGQSRLLWSHTCAVE